MHNATRMAEVGSLCTDPKNLDRLTEASAKEYPFNTWALFGFWL